MQFVEAGTPATIEIVGVDGSSWTVSGEDQGHEGVVLNNGAQGLQEAPRKGIWSQSAFQEGATYMGNTVEPIDLVLAFQVWGDEENWADVAAAFRKAWDYEQETIIRVSSEAGSRTIKVRLLEAPDRNSNKDPRLTQYSLDTYTLRAGWPFWEGDGAVDEFEVSLKTRPPSNVWEEMSEALRRLFSLESGIDKYDEGYVTVSNPTDTPLYPQWVATAPGRWAIPDWSFKDDEDAHRAVVCPTLGDGEDLTIDTYPRNEPYVSSLNTNIAGRFGGVLFLNPIPPRTAPTQVPVRYVGNDPNAKITVILRDKWMGPWN